MRILGIETSCDETAAGVVEDGVRLISNVVASQARLHAPYGGVVPELASREHEVNLIPVVRAALEPAGGMGGVDALAVTVGPGLQGSLLVGMTFAKAAAYAARLPAYAVNHLEAHLAALRLTRAPPEPPFVALLATGGHTALYDVTAWGDYRTLGETADDAAGEAFDKVARLLGMPYPGGPPLERAAAEGTPAFDFPRPMLKRGWSFSFAGLKTSVALRVKGLGEGETARRRADLAASFQEAALEVLAAKALRACEALGRERLAVVGGVAANERLREMLAAGAAAVYCPRPGLCGDNGAMVAAAGFLAAARGEVLDAAADPAPSLGLG
ncbi:MAG: tRNA (adenosine(37)-N6)-threonylcarbamoyltransferase complex transferase subunit TsaD [candidate division Zixibacteria bacterium]|nr:tRNA (adenosine(37)-N6)-threonylcarbamoyltransferase complex transferase subunit TsaD [candidate division Zixibacteria bacterium]